MIDLKNPSEIEIMAQAGKTSAKALKGALSAVKPGVTTLELDKIAEEIIRSEGAESAFKKVEDYQYTICVSVNDQVVHGLPSSYCLKEGDIIGIDTGAFYKGFNSDVSETVAVGQIEREAASFLETGKKALNKAIAEAKIGNRIGDISYQIQSTVEDGGYCVVRELIGHGVGRELHEEPAVPGEGKQATGEAVVEGMVLAIEVIFNMGKRNVYIDKDGWTVRTDDGHLSGLFERTVAITKAGPRILTLV